MFQLKKIMETLLVLGEQMQQQTIGLNHYD